MSQENPPVAYLAWGVTREERWRPRAPRWRLSLGLLLATLVTTTVVGARLAYNFRLGRPPYEDMDDFFPFAWVWHHPHLLAAGVPFSVAVMSVLLAHELGHFLACRYYRMECSYPMFLPAPTIIGTMGAVIRIRSPFQNRRELFDIGIAGPLAGLVLTLPLLAYGLAHSPVAPVGEWPALAGQQLLFGWPPLAQLLSAWLHPGVDTAHLMLSPLARAGWMGMLVTMLNLLPGAQLDGGHLLYAFSPRLHRGISLALIAVLLWAGWRFWNGWYVWAAIVALMRAEHPFVPAEGEMGAGRIALAVLAAAVLVLTFAAVPFRT